MAKSDRYTIFGMVGTIPCAVGGAGFIKWEHSGHTFLLGLSALAVVSSFGILVYTTFRATEPD
jgi:hypothetical protein